MIDIANPAWAMTPGQVRLLLQVSADHWHDYWAMPRIDIPEPVVKKEDLPKQALLRHAEDRRTLDTLRLQAVSALPKDHSYHRFLRRKLDLDADPTPERRLFGAILWEAIRNLYRDALHPLHLRQRRALSAHWWITGLQFPVPPRASYGALQEIRSGRVRQFKLTDRDDVFEWLQLSPAGFCTGPKEQLPYLPWPVSQQDWVNLDLTSFRRCCETVDLDADWLRKAVHVLPASWDSRQGVELAEEDE